MRTVFVRIGPADLVRTMETMREWLDRNRCEAASFSFDRDESGVTVEVGFSVDAEAVSFAARFAPPLEIPVDRAA